MAYAMHTMLCFIVAATMIVTSGMWCSARAQLVYEKGKPLSDAQANDTSMQQITTGDDGTGPVEAVIQGTNFPAHAITSVGANQATAPATGNRSSDAPVNLATRKIADPQQKEWPSDTADIFITSCAGMAHQLIAPCRCVIETLAKHMPFNEFSRLAEANLIEADSRYITARQHCLGNDASNLNR